MEETVTANAVGYFLAGVVLVGFVWFIYKKLTAPKNPSVGGGGGGSERTPTKSK